MKLKMNKALDLNSIHVLPPQARRTSSASPTGVDSSIFGNSQASVESVSQLRSQSSSQEASSHQGIFYQLSQNSPEDVLTNEQRLAFQGMEFSTKRVHCLPPVDHMRDESQMQITRSNTNLMRKWSPPENKVESLRQKIMNHDDLLQSMEQ